MSTEIQAKTAHDAVVNAIRDNLKEQTDQVFNGLVANVEKSKLPEAIFKEVFLPYFSGSKPIPPDVPVLAQWVSIAGTAMSEVEIIDENKEVLYTVPGLLDTTVVNTAKHNRGSGLSDIIANARMHGAGLPIVGERYLAEALQDKLSVMLRPTDIAGSNGPKWKAIYDRYGIKDANLQSSASSNDHEEDDVEY